MEFRDITNERTLLASYKTVFVDNQGYELVRPYRDHGRAFPVFLDRVFAPAARGGPLDFIDYRMRTSMDDTDAGRIFVLERNDSSAGKAVARLFWVWLSPALVKQYRDDTSNTPVLRANVVLHPRAGLEDYPAYWRGGVDPVKLPNFLELGARYLCKEKFTVAQHFCGVRRAGPKLDGGPCPSAFAVVVPVCSAAAYADLTDPATLSEALRHIGRRCYAAISARLVPVAAVQLERIAVSAYSRSGAVLSRLLAAGRRDDRFMSESLREVYAFDVMLDEKVAGRVVKTKRQGYDELWNRLTAWQGDDADKRIRLYSAERATVDGIYQELRTRLARYGGGYHNASVKFSSFNGTRRPDGTKFSGLADGYEIYSTDNSRSLVLLPSNNALVYLSTENLKNDGGFGLGGDYEPGLEGHSWFVSRLMSHALFHSGF
ncbi:hypothetical protein [Nocardia harenae]|uniref:hypothetical protein n=1 Tax=Nocardia harenae TaxID=358707 RepID=UPI000A7C658C|nr:hypothetical protein [Nocardia harenae]